MVNRNYQCGDLRLEEENGEALLEIWIFRAGGNATKLLRVRHLHGCERALAIPPSRVTKK